jgi:hypothetical protein
VKLIALGRGLSRYPVLVCQFWNPIPVPFFVSNDSKQSSHAVMPSANHADNQNGSLVQGKERASAGEGKHTVFIRSAFHGRLLLRSLKGSRFNYRSRSIEGALNKSFAFRRMLF